MFRFLRKNTEEANSIGLGQPPSSEENAIKKTPAVSTSQTHSRAQRNQRLSSKPIAASAERQHHASRLKEVVAVTMADDIQGLKPFESCIEAADTMASTSTSSSQRVDNSTGLLDCSVLVSADGDLLIIPQHQTDDSNKEEHESRNNWRWNQNSQSNELGEEYDSAIFLGNDLPDLGDKEVNGFSAKGWSMIAASLALKQSADTMGDLSQFLGDLVAAKQSSVEQSKKALDRLRGMVGVQHPELNGSKVAEYQKYLENNFAVEDVCQKAKQRTFRTMMMKNQRQQQEKLDLEVSPDRVGPLNQSGGTIAATQKALESYYVSVAKSESKRLANMTERSGALTKLRNATTKTEERVRRRQSALQETMSRMKTVENYLRECKADAKVKWDKVHKTEILVTRLVEEKMEEQNKLREEQRRLQMEKDNEQRIGGSEGQQVTSSSEIWDIVSAATASIEDGSFAPVLTRSFDTSSVVTDDTSPTYSTPFVPPEEMEFEMDSRYEFEVLYRLPELRVQAVAADAAVEEAASAFLNILSTWDTTRRSAQVAAETCLVSSGNAQASCLRSIIASERRAMDERLKLLEQLESVADEIDVRADVEKYITMDKTKEGGRSYRGEYDDGGVAFALKHLHGEDMEPENDDEINNDDSDECEDIDEEVEDHSSITSEYIEERLECFFQSRSLPKKELEASVAKLCAIGRVNSSKYVTRRATICYAMNAKRSTNAQIASLPQFDGLCKVFAAVLSGCNPKDDSGISSAILLMGLSEHFYVQIGKKDTYVKSRLAGHSLWEEDVFWDRALSQTITEKLNYSSVLSAFERDSQDEISTENKERSEWTDTPKTRWHDLTEMERYGAALQVNSVVFAQVSAMTDSMLELCGDSEKTAAFVRRVCVKNQLPLAQRTALLRHLTAGSMPVIDNQ